MRAPIGDCNIVLLNGGGEGGKGGKGGMGGKGGKSGKGAGTYWRL